MSNQLRAFLDVVSATVITGVAVVLAQLGMEWLEAHYTQAELGLVFGSMALAVLVVVGYIFRLEQLEAQDRMDKMSSRYD